jgi:hypothetical protein
MNNSGEKNYGTHVWEIYHRLYPWSCSGIYEALGSVGWERAIAHQSQLLLALAFFGIATKTKH